MGIGSSMPNMLNSNLQLFFEEESRILLSRDGVAMIQSMPHTRMRIIRQNKNYTTRKSVQKTSKIQQAYRSALS